VGSWRAAAVLVLIGAALLPHGADAGPLGPGGPGQEGPRATRERQAEVRRRQGEVTLEVDVIEARQSEIEAALATLDANVATQQAEVEEAQRAAAAAAQDLVEAQAAVAAAEQRLAELDEAADEFVVDAYVNPPGDGALDALSAGSISEATIKHELIDIQADSDADVFDQLREAHEDLEFERAAKEAIAAEAERKRQAAEEELAQLRAARAQQAAFAEEAAAALDRKLVEADNLASLDAQLSQQIAAEEAALARRLAAEAAARARASGSSAPPSSAGPGTIAPVPGGLASVSCAGGGAITIAGDLAPRLRSLLDAAAAEDVPLCGWGYRSAERQIALRRAHCGTSDYAIWHMPSWECSPPTARPGNSMHEVGLAVDFTCAGGGIGSRAGTCFRWLSQHAADYGLYNLPSEPWHWSVNGR